MHIIDSSSMIHYTFVSGVKDVIICLLPMHVTDFLSMTHFFAFEKNGRVHLWWWRQT